MSLEQRVGWIYARTLLDINPRINVVFLTAFGDYSLDAWSTGASGFLVKPITAEGVKAQLKNLRHMKDSITMAVAIISSVIMIWFADIMPLKINIPMLWLIINGLEIVISTFIMQKSNMK